MNPRALKSAALAACVALVACSPALDWREVRPSGTRLLAMFPCKAGAQQRSVRPVSYTHLLPAGKAVNLKPGGYHVMLMDLKQQLKVGETVAVTLVIERADKARETIEVKAPVKALSTPATDHKH